MKSFAVQVDKTLSTVVYVQASNHAEAQDFVRQNLEKVVLHQDDLEVVAFQHNFKNRSGQVKFISREEADA